jgi:membrane protease YdiL (CAAX protease family)
MEEISNPHFPRPRLRRWIFGTTLILISWVLFGSILTGITADRFNIDLDALAVDSEESRAILNGYAPWQTATTILISFAPLLIAVIALHRYLLHLPVRTLFTRNNRKLSREVFVGAIAMAILILISGAPDLIFNPENYKFNFEVSKFLPYLLIAFTLIPIQTSAEEVFFRGWIQQRLENGRRSIWLVSIIGGALFALPHLSNPEVNGELFFAILGYGASGFMFAWVSMRDQSIGIALGAHAVNNIMASLLVSSADSALPSVSIWTTPAVNWISAAILSLMTVPLFIWLTAKLGRKIS